MKIIRIIQKPYAKWGYNEFGTISWGLRWKFELFIYEDDFIINDRLLKRSLKRLVGVKSG